MPEVQHNTRQCYSASTTSYTVTVNNAGCIVHKRYISNGYTFTNSNNKRQAPHRYVPGKAQY